MPQNPHPRVITKEQFADSTTIDGNRLDRASSDVEAVTNSVPLDHISTRWVPNTYVMGWAVRIPSHNWPFMPELNNDASVVSNGTTPGAQNEYRVKGYVEYPDYKGLRAPGQFWIWTTPLYFHRPVVLWSFTLWTLVDHPTLHNMITPEFTEDWFYDGGTPPGDSAAADEGKGWSVVIHTDHPYDTEDRRLNAVNVIRTGQTMNRDQLTDWTSSNGWGQPTNEAAQGQFPGGPIHGNCMQLDLDEPIPARSRVRVSVIIPEFDQVLESMGGPTPQDEQYYSMNLTVLEEIRAR